MSKIKVTSKCELYDGMSITFKAPCASSAVDGLNVYYDGASQAFSFRDAHGNNISGTSTLFSSGAYIKAILDTTNGYAYIQNADSNGYLDGKIATLTQAAASAQSAADAAQTTADGKAPASLVSYTFSSVSSSDAVDANLNTVLAAMPNNSVAHAVMSMSTSFAPFYGGTQVFTINKVSSTYASVTSIAYGSSSMGYLNLNGRGLYNGTWQSWYKLSHSGDGASARIATGRYTGTGTYGSANPNSLTFDFVPKVVYVIYAASTNYMLRMVSGCTSVNSSTTSSSANTVSWSGNTVTWYTSDVYCQMNVSGKAYYYFAIG